MIDQWYINISYQWNYYILMFSIPKLKKIEGIHADEFFFFFLVKIHADEFNSSAWAVLLFEQPAASMCVPAILLFSIFLSIILDYLPDSQLATMPVFQRQILAQQTRNKNSMQWRVPSLRKTTSELIFLHF